MKLPKLPTGDYKLVVATRSNLGEEKVERDVKVKGEPKVLLVTDKPLYQPGQTIHLRALALDRVTQKPVGNQAVTFEISDGKGNKICKRTRQSDGYGLASTDFVLGQVLNLGTFQLRVLVGADKAEKTVTVSRYALPKFKVALPTESLMRPLPLIAATVAGLPARSNTPFAARLPALAPAPSAV